MVQIFTKFLILIWFAKRALLSVMSENTINLIEPRKSNIDLPKANSEKNLNFMEARKSNYDLPSTENIVSNFKCPPSMPYQVEDYDNGECRKMVQESLKAGHPDQFKKTPEILAKYGYSTTEYEITTEDGYQLTVFRLGNYTSRKKKHHNTPVYLNAGLFGTSDWFLLVPIQKTLPIMLAEDGYDVWLSNSRGNSYSLGHETLDHAKNISYWDFSFHEMGIYDMVAVTETMIAESGRTDVLYIGYSMGTNVYLASLSEIPEMNNKIRAAFLLAPSSHIGHSSNPYRNLCPLVDNQERLNFSTTVTKGRLMNNEDFRKVFGVALNDICVTSASQCGLCENYWFFLFGVNVPQLNRSMLPLILEKVPDYGSIKTLAHFAQLIESCRFQKYDYNKAKNLELYGSEEPPVYNIKKVKAPTHIYYSEQDNFVYLKDLSTLLNSFRQGVLKKAYPVKDKLFTHLDFCTAKDVDKLVYKELLRDMRNYRDVT